MAQMKLIYALASKLNDLPISNGQIIYAPDDNIICLDMRNQRFTYKTIRTFATDAERLAATSASVGFYYVEETNIIWRKTLNGTWKQVTSSKMKSVVYGHTELDFPQIGEEGVLYYSDRGIYRWDPQSEKYILISNVNIWESID